MLEPHQRALALVGTPFRPQGRDPASGLDCVGLVLCSFELRPACAPDYRLTDGDWPRIESELSPWFVRIEDGPRRSGDVAVFRTRRGFHFGVISGHHLVHADLTLGKVVTRRLPVRLAAGCRIYRSRGAC